MSFDHKSIEKKWQNYWEKNKTFKSPDFSPKKKFYVLDMFPYPSEQVSMLVTQRDIRQQTLLPE